TTHQATASLLVVLHDRRWALLCGVGSQPRMASRPPLAQEVPQAVDLHLKLAQPYMLRLVQSTAVLALVEQVVLLVGHPRDLIQNLWVFHVQSAFQSKFKRVGDCACDAAHRTSVAPVWGPRRARIRWRRVTALQTARSLTSP